MRVIMAIALVNITLLLVSCSEKSEKDKMTGTWLGTVTEKNESTSVELKLLSKEGNINGSLTILSETDSDVSKGASFEIVNVSCNGNKIEFTVPITGEIDDDAVVFELILDGNKLTGYGHERRDGSDRLPITFTKQER